MHIHPSHAVVSVSLDRGLRMSLQPEATDRLWVLWGVKEEHGAFWSSIRTIFDVIDLEDRRIVESIARTLKNGLFGPGRQSPGEIILRECRRCLAMRFT